MRRSHRFVAGMLCIAFGLAAASAAQAASPAPEELLADESVIYVRFDGLESHRQAFDKTIVAELLREELAPLVNYISTIIMDALGPDVVAERLLQGAEPDRLIELQKAAKQLPHLTDFLLQHGLVVGVEVLPDPVPGAQATLVFPDGGQEKYREAFFAAVRLIAALNQTPVKDVKRGERSIMQVDVAEVRLYCWQEGPHVVWTIGTGKLDQTLALIEDGKRKSLAANPLLEQLAGFKDYETYARGFVDAERAFAAVRQVFPPAQRMLDDLGLSGLTSFTFQLGFQEQYQRSTVMLNTKGERKGALAALSATAPVTIDSLPAIAPDASTVGATGFELGALFDSTMGTINMVLQLADPSSAEQFQKEWEKFEKKLGLDLRRDLLDALGPTIVSYTAPSEGALFFGVGVAVEVQDEKKADASIRRIINVLAQSAGTDVAVRQTTYRGAQLNVIEFDADEFPFTPTYAIHDGWLVIGFTPQVAQGFIFRNTGDRARWQASPLLMQAIEESRQRTLPDGSPPKIFGFSQTDPRPTLQQIISFAPFVIAIARNFPGSTVKFDASLIPNSQAITERLSPNASVFTDDGRTIRIDSYSTFPMPIDLASTGYLYMTPFFLFGF